MIPVHNQSYRLTLSTKVEDGTEVQATAEGKSFGVLVAQLRDALDAHLEETPVSIFVDGLLTEEKKVPWHPERAKLHAALMKAAREWKQE